MGVVNFFGEFREGGPVTLVGMLMHPDEITLVDQANVTNWDINVYDNDSATPTTAVWSVADQTDGFTVGKTTGKYETAAPNGYTFLKIIRHDDADDASTKWDTVAIGGRRYRFEVVVTADEEELDNYAWVWFADCVDRTTGTIS